MPDILTIIAAFDTEVIWEMYNIVSEYISRLYQWNVEIKMYFKIHGKLQIQDFLFDKWIGFG